ncbi:MAG: putative FmdB family regulatory protein [Planctomycetota bacterium]|jgi:putative FmdB family regulatory protein
MPHYDYICKACGAKHEMFQSMSEAHKRKCPACGKLKLERQFGTGAGILFKGSGFYETDYRSDSYQKAAKADSKATESSSGSEGAKKESKPKAKDSDKSKKPE